MLGVGFVESVELTLVHPVQTWIVELHVFRDWEPAWIYDKAICSLTLFHQNPLGKAGGNHPFLVNLFFAPTSNVKVQNLHFTIMHTEESCNEQGSRQDWASVKKIRLSTFNIVCRLACLFKRLRHGVEQIFSCLWLPASCIHTDEGFPSLKTWYQINNPHQADHLLQDNILHSRITREAPTFLSCHHPKLAAVKTWEARKYIDHRQHFHLLVALWVTHQLCGSDTSLSNVAPELSAMKPFNPLLQEEWLQVHAPDADFALKDAGFADLCHQNPRKLSGGSVIVPSHQKRLCIGHFAQWYIPKCCVVR